MTENMLKLNEYKTEFLLVSGEHQKLTKFDLQVDGITIENSKSVQSLGVTFDTNLSMSDHINSICRSSYYHLYKISNICRYLSFDATERRIHDLISWRLDFCNSLLYGLTKMETSKLQRIQNIAARILTDTRRWDHIRLILMSPHWLPVKVRIVFKILTLVYKCLHESAPSLSFWVVWDL